MMMTEPGNDDRTEGDDSAGSDSRAGRRGHVRRTMRTERQWRSSGVDRASRLTKTVQGG